MVSKSVANSMLLLRIVALAASVITVALIVTNNVKFDDGTKLKFQDIHSYSYVLVVAAIAGAYCLVQLPFAIYYAVQQKRLIRNEFLPELDFYGDKVISLLLATGVGVGFTVSIEFKKFFDDLFDGSGVPKTDPTRSTNDKFYIRGIVASAILLVACVAMAVVSVISSINRHRSKGVFR
ncbi:CASP-like protein 4D1 [Gastrolobium bilobum]|uniref:CASP-like protein 4D1 n=1 Tax=Gastrolobium bilobum TaxID=150636 RepID=UPI002AB2AB61|nr:CASP-like protein 4D1 [Gastrolobium bilobum]